MTDSKLEDLIEDYTITLNGLNAEVYQTPNGILISNNDFSSPDLEYQEIHMPYDEFKEELIKNKGKFES